MTSLPSRAVASLASSTVLRIGGTSSINALAASMRNFGLEVRAGRAAAQPRQLLAHQVLPLGLRRRGDPVPLDALQDIGGVPAFEGVDDPVVHLPRRGRDLVEEPAVVRHQEKPACTAPPAPFRCAASQVMPSMSRWLVGSSSAMTSQPPISNAANCTRRRCPPDSVEICASQAMSDTRPSTTSRILGVGGPFVVGLVAEEFPTDGAAAVEGVGLVEDADAQAAAARHPAGIGQRFAR